MEALRDLHPALPDLVQLLVLLSAALLAYWLTKAVFVRLARRYAERSEQTWDDAMIAFRVPSRLAQLVPAFIIYLGVDLLPGFEDTVEQLLLKATGAYMILVVTFTLTAVLSAANAIYEEYPMSRQRPLSDFDLVRQVLNPGLRTWCILPPIGFSLEIRCKEFAHAY